MFQFGEPYFGVIKIISYHRLISVHYVLHMPPKNIRAGFQNRLNNKHLSIFEVMICFCFNLHLVILTLVLLRYCSSPGVIHYIAAIFCNCSSELTVLFIILSLYFNRNEANHSKINGVPWMGLNFYDYHDFQKKARGVE